MKGLETEQPSSVFQVFQESQVNQQKLVSQLSPKKFIVCFEKYGNFFKSIYNSYKSKSRVT